MCTGRVAVTATAAATTTAEAAAATASATVSAAATDAGALLQLMWLASPALPVGGFSYSDGLGAAVEAGCVHDEASATVWLHDQLLLSLGRGELPLLGAAIAAWRADDTPRVRALNDWCVHTRESAEFRQQTFQMGRSLGAWLANRPHDPLGAAQLIALKGLDPAPCWPIAFGLAAALTTAAPRDALLAFAFGWSENAVQAAVKAVPLGQNAGQRILAALTAEIPSVVLRAATLTGDDQRQAYTPMLAIRSAQHETQYSRLFRS